MTDKGNCDKLIINVSDNGYHDQIGGCELNSKFMKIIYIFLGFFFVALGGLGVVLPVLPTTPFLLLASYFFVKGSERFNNWFMSTKLYKNYLEDFVRDRALEKKTKVKILLPASVMLLLAFYIVDILPFRIFIGFMFIYKYYYFTRKIKTIKPETRKSSYCVKTDRT